jgi:hypothetical protein
MIQYYKIKFSSSFILFNLLYLLSFIFYLLFHVAASRGVK